MESTFMALGLLNEAKLRNRQSDDWERDIDRLEQQHELYSRRQAIVAAVSSIVQFFRRPTTAFKGAHA